MAIEKLFDVTFIPQIGTKDDRSRSGNFDSIAGKDTSTRRHQWGRQLHYTRQTGRANNSWRITPAWARLCGKQQGFLSQDM
jgi:hypothetical protein